MVYKFRAPTWIASERGNGKPGILAVDKTHGRLRPQKNNPLICGWRCRGKTSDDEPCPNKGICILVSTDNCECCFDQYNNPLPTCRKGPLKFEKWKEGEDPTGCNCVTAMRAIKEYGKHAPTITWGRHRMNDLTRMSMKTSKASFEVVNKGMKMEERSVAGKSRLMASVRVRKHRRKSICFLLNLSKYEKSSFFVRKPTSYSITPRTSSSF